MHTCQMQKTYLRMIVLAPKMRVSTSSVKTASITPIRLRYASSASASPKAWGTFYMAVIQ